MQHIIVFLIIWLTIGTMWFIFKLFDIELHSPAINRNVKKSDWPIFFIATAFLWPYAMWVYLRRPPRKTQ